MSAARGEFSRRRYQFYGLAFVLVAAMFFGATIGSYQKVFSSVVPVTLETSRIGNQMREGADVKVRGVVVGEVRSIESTGKNAELGLALEPDKAKLIPSDSAARLVPKTLFGERYVALQMPPESTTDKKLSVGDVITQDRSSAAIEVEQVMNDLLPVLQAVRPQDLSLTLNAVSQAVEGRGEQLGQTIVELDNYLKRFNPSLPDLENVISRIDDVSRTHAQAAPDLMRSLNDLSTTSRTIAEQRTNIQYMMETVTATSENSRSFLEANGENLIRLTSTARPTLEVLGKYAPEYPCMLKQVADSIPDAEKAFGKGDEIPMQKVTIELTGSRGKYEPGVDTPQNGDTRGPRCYPQAPRPEERFPQYPPGGPVQDGSTKPPPENPGISFPATGLASSTTPQSASGGAAAAPGPEAGAGAGGTESQIANAPSERRLISALLAPSMGVPPSDVPQWSSVLVGPAYRGTEVDLK